MLEYLRNLEPKGLAGVNNINVGRWMQTFENSLNVCVLVLSRQANMKSYFRKEGQVTMYNMAKCSVCFTIPSNVNIGEMVFRKTVKLLPIYSLP